MSAQKYVIVANEPDLYRTTIAVALRLRRPQLKILSVNPTAINRGLMWFHPTLMLCSRLSLISTFNPQMWILLYPEGSRLVVVQRKKVRLEEEYCSFDKLLVMIDEALDAIAFR